MELKTYLAILWRRKVLITVTVAVTVIIAFIGMLMMTPIYEASTTLRILTAAGGSVDWVNYEIEYADRLMNTYAKTATSGPVLKELMQQLNLVEPPEVTVEILANTELMQITVEDPNPVLASDAANTLAEILVVQSQGLNDGNRKPAQDLLNEQLAQAKAKLDQAQKDYENLITQSPDNSEAIAAADRFIKLKEETYAKLLEQYEQMRVRDAIQANTLSIIEPATIPQTASKPRKALNIALGILIGIAGGLGLAFLFENLDSTLYTREQIEAVTKAVILGQIPTGMGRQQLAFLSSNSAQVEAFRRLSTNIFHSDGKPPLRTLLITSAEPGEGKSTIMANLAFTIAQTKQKVVIIDGDLRRPTLHQIFDLPNGIGLRNILQQEVTLAEALQDSQKAGVQVITSGPPYPPNPVELLSSAQMTDLLEQLHQQFDVVLLDTPALLAVTDATVLAPIVDGIALVVRRAQSRQETVRAACEQLTNIKAELLGVILNGAEQDGSYASYYQPQYNLKMPLAPPERAMARLGLLSSLPINRRIAMLLSTLLVSIVAVMGIGICFWLNLGAILASPPSFADGSDVTEYEAQATIQTLTAEAKSADEIEIAARLADQTPDGAEAKATPITQTNQPETATPLPTPSPHPTTATRVITLRAPTPEINSTPDSVNRPTVTATPTPSPTTTTASAPVLVATPKAAVVVYAQSNFQGHDLNIIKSTGEFIKSLHTHAAAPAWSPDASTIAFFGEPGITGLGGIYQQGNGLWLIDAWQNREPRQLVQIDHIENIAWSPDGTKLAFEVAEPNVAEAIMVVDTSGGQEISRFPGRQPAWSPDSQKLAIKACLPSCGLWLVNFDGSGGQQVTADASDSYPAWSPNGQLIVFSSQNRDGNWEIYGLQLDGNIPQGEPQRLTQRDGVDTTPSFSPDGREIYLRTDTLGAWRITAITVDGSNERLVMEGVGPSDKWGLARPAVR